ncbi:MAG: peptide chain release factor N(5)-glutamine methyltransferase [Anaerolineales bacterium]|nr:peptide chain release factor N(5)-glutamine methyltransferase [Anaerolineales bacterium]
MQKDPMNASFSLLSHTVNRLSSISDTPTLDASVLIAHVINKPRTWVMAHPELTITNEQQQKLEDSLLRLERGESFPYVLGHWEFFNLEFDVTPDVLIPRPETELLVEKAIAWLNKHPDRRMIADIGTGSGAIAVSLAVNVPDANILATDISAKALQIATQNSVKHKAGGKIKFMECDLLPKAGIKDHQQIDLLCANLPYIPTETLHALSVFGHEPTIALDGGQDGFELIRKLMNMAINYLAPNALMLFEIEATLGKQALNLAHEIFPNAQTQLHQDLTGRDRLLEIELR